MRRCPLRFALCPLWFACLAWLWVTAWLEPSSVFAAEVRVLVAARDQACLSLARRTQAESEAAGFVAPGATPPIVPAGETDSLVRLMEERAVQALVLVSDCSDASEISVLVIDPVSGRDHFRRMDRRAAGAEASIALQAVELLRAAWLETGIAQPNQLGVSESRPAADTRSSRVDPLPSVSLTLSSGGSYSPGGVFPTWKVVTGLELYTQDWLGAALDLSGAPLPAHVHGDRSLTLR